MGIKIGQTFAERYTIEALLGEGGFGVVYAGLQQSTGQRVAIKVLHPPEAQGNHADMAMRRFEREMQLIAALAHPNIVRLIDSGRTSEDELFAVMEFIEGQDLAHVLESEGRLESFEAQRLMSQVLDALSSAHARGVVHRDLKPQNIMITRTGARRNAVVLDFGIAGVLNNEDGKGETLSKLTAMGQVPGTPAYMAPEQIEGQSTPQSDIYAWGLVYLEALTGKTAVMGGSPLSTLMRHARPEPVPIPASVLELSVAPIIERAVEKELNLRYATAQEVLDDLERLERGVLIRPSSSPGDIGSRVTAPAPVLDLTTTPGTKQHTEMRLMTTAIVLLIVLITVAVVIFLVLGSSSDDTESKGTRSTSEAQSRLPRPVDSVQREAQVEVIAVEEPVRELRWVPGEEQIVVGGERGALAVFDVPTHERVKTLSHAMMTSSVAVSPDGRLIASGGMGVKGFTAALFERKSGTLLSEWVFNNGMVDGLSFSSDASQLAVGSLSSKLFRTDNGEEMDPLPSYDTSAVDVLFLPGEESVIVACADGRVVRYNLVSQVETLSYGQGGAVLTAAALTPDGRLLVTADVEGNILIWDVERGEVLKKIEVGSAVYAIALSHDGRLVASGAGQGRVVVWDIASGKQRLDLKGHTHVVMTVQFHPIDGRLATAGKDGMVRIWELKW